MYKYSLLALLVFANTKIQASGQLPSLQELTVRTVMNQDIELADLPSYFEYLSIDLDELSLGVQQAFLKAIQNRFKDQLDSFFADPCSLDNFIISGIPAVVSQEYLVYKATDSNRVTVWDVKTRQSIHILEHPAYVTSVVVSLDGNYLFTSCCDKIIRMWAIQSGKVLREFSINNLDSAELLAVSPDNKYVAASYHKTIEVWSSQNGKLLYTFNDNGRCSIKLLAISSNNNYIVANSANNVKVWSGQTGQLIHTLNHKSQVKSLAISPNNEYIVTGSRNGTAKVWSSRTGQVIYKLANNSDSIISVAISSDSNYIIIGSKDRRITIWDSKTGKLIYSVIHHDDNSVLRAVDFHKNFIVAKSCPKNWQIGDAIIIKIWDMRYFTNTIKLSELVACIKNRLSQ